MESEVGGARKCSDPPLPSDPVCERLPDDGVSGGAGYQKLDIAHYFLFALLLLVLLSCYRMLHPYLSPIILALILAAILAPVHERVLRLVKGRGNTAAVLSCLFLTLVVVLPLLVMAVALIRQGIDSFTGISQWIAAGQYKQVAAHPAVAAVTGAAARYLPDLKAVFPNVDPGNFELSEILLKLTSATGRFLVDRGGMFFSNLSVLAAKFFLMIFAFFFFVRDQKKLYAYLMHLIPLRNSQEEKIIEKIKAVAQSALLGTLVTAAAQGVAGGVAFWICGLPGLFWGMVMAFTSFIPIVGTSLVWVPATAFLFFSGSWGYGVFLLVWSVVIVGSIDNLVRPIFMQGGADMSTLLIFLAILGGINSFGLIGLLYGPLLFGLGMVLLYVYSIEFDGFLSFQDKQ